MIQKKSIISPSRRQSLLSSVSRRGTHAASLLLLGGATGALVLAAPQRAAAFNLYSGSYAGQQLQINLDTTLEYSNVYRVNDPSAVLTNNINGDEGDRDFRHGFVDNTFDALPVFDMKYGDYGVHVSGEFFVDTSYLDKNQNNSPSSYNPISTNSNRDFTSATRNVNGLNAVLLDAFGYGSKYFGANDSQEITVKVGRQTLLWGQSLFFAGNGIAAGQAPLDIIKAESLPNAEAQQIFLPIGQAVVTYQPNQTVTLQGYYQFEWAPDTFQGVGAYFSSTDVLDKGGQRLLVAPGVGFYRVKDNRPPINNGEFGGSVQLTLGNYDLGFYGLRYDAKAPELYLGPAAYGQPLSSIGSYYLVYPRDIQIYGSALSTTVGPVNVAGEVSGRRNMPLVSGAAFETAYPGSANAGALYAVGSTMAAQASAIYVSPGIPLDPGGVTVDGEIAMNHVISVDKNKSELTVGRQATAGAVEVVATPAYFNVFPNTELEFPIGLTYDFLGRSEIDQTMNHGTGSFSFGVTAVYRTTWTAGLTYHDYFGKADVNLNPLADRGYLSFNMEHTF
jgi:hypothetical protein